MKKSKKSRKPRSQSADKSCERGAFYASKEGSSDDWRW